MSAKLPKQHLIRPEWNRQKILASGDPSTFQPIFSQFSANFAGRRWAVALQAL
jgi:hypothetical protein